jgi:hypothetical protein
MALCRFGSDSDVYVYYSIHGGIEGRGCQLVANGMLNVPSEERMLAHLEEHRLAGHRVPDVAFEDLRVKGRDASLS